MPPPSYSSPSRTAGASHAPPGGSAAGVQVLVRVRPPLPRELMFDSGVDVKQPYDIKVYNAAQEFSGRYHGAFGEDTAQAEVYERVRDCVPLALAGYNSTIFAYGQTGTGKTYTMMGDDPSMDTAAAQAAAAARPGGAGGPGIIPRAVKELFREAKAKQDAEGAAIQIVVSYMEIYNDRLHDLLQPYKASSTRDPNDVNQKRALLEVREDAKGNTYVPNLLCVKVKSYKSVYQLIAKGNRNRAVRHTEMNQASSRSHAILQLVVEQWPNGGADGTVIRSKLNFVDLAGSERWNTNASGWDGTPDLMGGERISEMTAINGSLSALGSVVAALTERRPHVPYRDSRLTHLLQDSLGGNCRTTVLATLSPSVDAFEESCSTLRFADRASAIANNPVVNASRDVGSILALKEREIQRLRNMLSQYANGQGPEGNGGAAGGAAGGPEAARLTEELEATRRALEMERALRAELQQRLHPDSGPPGTAMGLEGGGGIVLGATQLLGTPSTAFDQAGHHGGGGPGPGPAALRAGSLHSSAGSGGGGGGPGGVDFFRPSTPSTPLNPVPQHLLGAGPGGPGSPGGAALTPTRGGPGGGNAMGRSRSNMRSSNSRLAGGGPASVPPRTGGGGGPGGSGAPGRPNSRGGGLTRRLSFDEAIMSIKTQIINLSSQERNRMKARQPPPKQYWGGLPPPPGPGAAAAQLAAMASANSASPTGKSFTTRTKTAAAIYASTGSNSGAAPPMAGGYGGQQQQRRPPALAVGHGMVASGGFGGGPASLQNIPSIDMTESPGGSDVVSPGSHTLIHQNQTPPPQARAFQQAYLSQQQQQQRSPPAATDKSRSYTEGYGRGGGGDDDDVDDGVAEEDGVADQEERRRGEGQGEEEDVADEDEDEDEGAGGRTAGGGDSDGGLSQLDADEYEEIMREAREALAKQQAEAAGSGGGGGGGGGRGALAAEARSSGAGAAAGGGGGRAALLGAQPSSAPPAVGASVSGAGAWGRNALLNKFTDGPESSPGGAAAAGGGGFGRSSLLAAAAVTAGMPSSAPPGSSGGGGGGGWGRKSILAGPAGPPPPASADAANALYASVAGQLTHAPTAPPPPAAQPPQAGGRRALIAELLAEDEANSPYARGRNSGAGAAGKGRSKSVGVAGRPNGGSRGNAADRVSKLDAGSWIYILGASASSTRAKQLAAALQLDPRTGLPAL
ncbi:hypothetical protein HXX76_001836 [Chlamydomonas incerta]|uniref:Kinesin motor domain-containing protein n=1 Tax=Chlamydomonas incerta TaxID=51695 RepID=A0A835TE72_CHLIN|nr:hypothetical protein HXX76_001836 [Chlamydomonas incerta]|eukprot:KAG2443483.1 hypothetical protein HXX76_001836 [Chlamydomonas incerta]